MKPVVFLSDIFFVFDPEPKYISTQTLHSKYPSSEVLLQTWKEYKCLLKTWAGLCLFLSRTKKNLHSNISLKWTGHWPSISTSHILQTSQPETKIGKISKFVNILIFFPKIFYRKYMITPSVRYFWALKLELFSSTLWWAFIRGTWVVMWKLKKRFRFNISLWWLDSFSERDHILNIWYRWHELVAESKEQDADQRYKCQPKNRVQEPRQPSQTGYPTASTLKVEIGKKKSWQFLDLNLSTGSGVFLQYYTWSHWRLLFLANIERIKTPALTNWSPKHPRKKRSM